MKVTGDDVKTLHVWAVAYTGSSSGKDNSKSSDHRNVRIGNWVNRQGK